MTQSKTSITFVLVHGAWSGGWCYARVAALLRARGHTVFTPTLTGQGERAHLLSGAINLSTHIEDVLGVFHYERMSDVVLAGHSYGGMVITGVAVASRTRSRRSPTWTHSFRRMGSRCSTSTFRPTRSAFSITPARAAG
jgi:pimeloyl-ACP methyl ester carboxylesterase